MRTASYGHRGDPSGPAPWRRLVVGSAAALLLIAAVAAGCGVPIDDAPEPIPFPAQFQTSMLTAEPPPTTASGAISVVLCLTRDQKLVHVPRQVDTMPSPQDLLADLIAGPTEAERADELSSGLVGVQTLSVADVDAGIAHVEVGDSLTALSGPTRLLIYGQIVCTLDQHPSIDGVLFRLNGQPIPVPRGDGASTDQVLTASDYDEILERATAAPTQ